MYIPAQFREDDHQTIVEFLKENNFPAIMSYDGVKPIATHAPVEITEGGNGKMVIYGHFSRANPQWKTFGDQEILLIFQGAHAYISARWYNHVNVPTWNYMMVHVSGTVRFVEGEELYALLSRLVQQQEAHSPYRLESLPQDFVQKEIKGVVGFAIEVTRIEAGYKLSQNRNDEDHETIVRELDKRGDEDSVKIAGAMRKKRGGRKQRE